METNTKSTLKNNLRQYRKRSGLGQKQLAHLLGRKRSNGISKYENDIQNPSLKTALKFEIIYQTPVRLLYQELFEECRTEIKQQRKSGSGILPDRLWFPSHAERLMGEQFCFYAELAKDHVPNPAEREIIKDHAVSLTRVLYDYENDRYPFAEIKDEQQ